MFDHVQVFVMIQVNIFRRHSVLSNITGLMVPKLQFYENKVAAKEDEPNLKFRIDWKTDQ